MPSDRPESMAALRYAADRIISAKSHTVARRRSEPMEGEVLGGMAFAPPGGHPVRLVLRPDSTHGAPSEALEAGLLLRIPLPRTESEPDSESESTSGMRVVEITVFAPGGERELVERHNLAANRPWIESPLPAAWLTPGEFRVLVVVENEAPKEFHFSLRAPAPSHSR